MHNTAINNLYKLTNKIIKKNPKKVLTNHSSSGIINTERGKNKSSKRKEIRTMTKKELIEMLKDINDNDEVVFIETDLDRDGWIVERKRDIVKVEKK